MRTILPTPGTVAASVIIAVALLTGCLGRSPSTQHYSLQPVPGRSIGSTTNLALSVGPARLPRYLDRPQMVTREGNEVGIDEFNRWAGGFEANVLRALSANLAARLQTERIVTAPMEAPFPIDYQILIDFDELVAVDGRELMLRVRWVVKDSESASLAVELLALDLPIGRASVAGRVQAHQEAMGQLADAIAARIATLASEAPAGEEANAQP